MVPIRIKDTLRNFAGNTTLHGINRVSSSKHVIGKVLWTCIVLTCVALCFRQIYTLGVQYGSYSKVEENAHFKEIEMNEDYLEKLFANYLYSVHHKIITEINKQFEDSAASYGKRKKRDVRGTTAVSQARPNVTIQRTYYTSDEGFYKCTAGNNYNIAESPRIYLKIIVMDLDVDPILSASEEFRLSMSVLGKYGHFEQITEKAMKYLTADFSDFVIHCNYEGRPCNESVFVPFFDKYYGLCYRFPPEPIITKRAGPLFALQLLINVNQSDYVPYIASEAGIRLSIHEHGSQPYLENNGISVATGFRTDVSLVKFESFLSNIGGSLGLWIGMSAISIGELLELCLFLLRSMARHKKVIENQTNVNLNETVETTSISNEKNK
ncbi:unnamed protein product [Mytilus coruscus]|uniref:SCNN1B n=1 Tax=Mytilus coruscus TaxID=42192 RepID=A0A6J8DS89_MYTCO|nr:unnamed protein product [Mytilus coruscus]